MIQVLDAENLCRVGDLGPENVIFRGTSCRAGALSKNCIGCLNTPDGELSFQADTVTEFVQIWGSNLEA